MQQSESARLYFFVQVLQSRHYMSSLCSFLGPSVVPTEISKLVIRSVVPRY